MDVLFIKKICQLKWRMFIKIQLKKKYAEGKMIICKFDDATKIKRSR